MYLTTTKLLIGRIFQYNKKNNILKYILKSHCVWIYFKKMQNAKLSLSHCLPLQ